MKKWLKLAAPTFASLIVAGAIVPTVYAEKEVLEFYHGYHQDESEWPVAKTMRDLFDEFAKEHANGEVEFKPIPVSGSLVDIMNNKVASGAFPDIIDLAGQSLSLAAIEQNLVMDLKPYIDEKKLQDNVGLNYTQNMVDGKLYTVHDQLFTMGLWYNQDIFKKAGAKEPQDWVTWKDFSEAMATVRKVDGIYAYGAGETSIRLLNTYLGMSEEGRALLNQPLTNEAIDSPAFTEALTAVMTEVNANGSTHAGGTADVYSSDFAQGKSAVFINGVWAAGGMKDNKALQPGLYPGGVAISSAGGGITISNQLSEPKKKLALEFLEYMTSEKVQKVIFEKVGANPANSKVDIDGIVKANSDPTVQILGKALKQVHGANQTVTTIANAWGGDVKDALINALTESAADGVNIEQKVQETKDVLKALIN
ncbi:ABC transporter substrate-binding protein [Abiotrophia defectiva]